MLATALPPRPRATSSEINAEGWRDPATITPRISRERSFAVSIAARGIALAGVSAANRPSCSVPPMMHHHRHSRDGGYPLPPQGEGRLGVVSGSPPPRG